MSKKLKGYIIIILTTVVAITGVAFVCLRASIELTVLALTVGILNAVISYWISGRITGFKQEGFEKKLPMIISLILALITFLLGLISCGIHHNEFLGYLGAYAIWAAFTFPYIVTFLVQLVVYIVMKKYFGEDDGQDDGQDDED